MRTVHVPLKSIKCTELRYSDSRASDIVARNERNRGRQPRADETFFFSPCWADVLNLPVSVNFEDIDSFYTNLKLISLISCAYYSQKTRQGKAFN